jgi:hypothetical protein
MRGSGGGASGLMIIGTATKVQRNSGHARGILTLDSDWSPLFGDPLRQALTARNEDEALDLGCVLRHGGFEAPNPSQPGSLAATGKETAVIFFTLRLLKRLQAMATVPAINYDAYAATVWP